MKKNKPNENVMLSKKFNLGVQTKKGKILENENIKRLNEEIQDDDEEKEFQFQVFDQEKELEQIKQAMIESINDSLSRTKDEKEVIELKKRLEEINDKNFKFKL